MKVEDFLKEHLKEHSIKVHKDYITNLLKQYGTIMYYNGYYDGVKSEEYINKDRLNKLKKNEIQHNN